ncbi:MAG: hypothetical protein MUE72_11575 [Chitinophagaceae bacterium]|jgi:hypothetical protein|nr:hypothetical protein [Chitinophagaceae bacterium]
MQIPTPKEETFRGTLQDLIYSTFMRGTCCGHEDIDVDSSSTVVLDPPRDAVLAIVIVVPNELTVDTSKVISFTLTPAGIPTDNSGMILGKGGMRILTGADLNNAKFIGVESGLTHSIRVEYRK